MKTYLKMILYSAITVIGWVLCFGAGGYWAHFDSTPHCIEFGAILTLGMYCCAFGNKWLVDVIREKQ